MKSHRRIAVLACLIGSIAMAAHADLIANPGFEDNNPADGAYGDGWGSFGAQAFLNFFPEGNPGHATFFADNVANSGGIFQAGIGATPGAQYVFQIDAAFEANWSARTQLGLEFYQADDATLIDQFTIELFEPLPDTSYSTYTVQATAPAGTVYVRPVVRYDTVTDVQGSGEAATFDNAVLTIVPEPSVVALLGLSLGLAMVGRRRRTPR